MKFTQHVVVWTDDLDALKELFSDYDHDAAKEAGMLGAKLLAFRDKPGRYVIHVEFDSWESAQANNDRPETAAWAARLNDIITQEAKYENLDLLAEYDV